MNIIPGTWTEIHVERRDTGEPVGRLVRADDSIAYVKNEHGRIVRWDRDSVRGVHRSRPCFIVADGAWSAPFDTQEQAVVAREWLAEFGHALPGEHRWQ